MAQLWIQKSFLCGVNTNDNEEKCKRRGAKRLQNYRMIFIN